MGKAISEQEILYSFEDALSNGSIVPYYQPQINHSTGRMMGAEALIRWHHIVLGSQSPANFIPVLEAHDLIYKADLFIFEAVCKFLRKCFDQGISPVPISVNMSRCDLYLLDYVREIERIRRQYEIPVRYLRIEITETAAIDGPEQKEGEPSLEGVIPLSKWRVPFHIRYTTVFDQKGRPWKAYASATMVIDEDEKTPIM